MRSGSSNCLKMCGSLYWDLGKLTVRSRPWNTFSRVSHLSPLVPSTFGSWWLQWEEVSPIDFPLPPSMRHFGPVKKNLPARFIFGSTQQESDLSKAITRAWEAIPETSRQSMLFCWSGLPSVRLVRMGDDMENSSAKAILRQDSRDNFESLPCSSWLHGRLPI